ncbi:cytochrome P450 [bacterium]|nr:cytochrome P450 [bacterium]
MLTLAPVHDADSEPLPVTAGCLLDFPDDPIVCMRRLQRQHGSIAALEQDGQRLHFVFSPELNHQILTNTAVYHSRFFAVRGPRQSAQRRLTSGLLSANGADHKRQRRMVMEAFLKKAIHGYLPMIRDLTEEMLQSWQIGQTRDLSRDMTDFMLRLTSSLLFGMDNPELAYRIGRMIDQWVQLNHELGISVFVSSPEMTLRYEELLHFAGELETEIAGMIAQQRQSGAGEQNLLSMILQGHDEQGSLSPDELVGQAALIFGAAHLTTAHTLTWALFLLAQHPETLTAVQHELRYHLDGRFPTLDAVEPLKQMEAAIKESMRVLPASAYSQRMTVEPTQLGPLHLPRGSAVVFSQFMTHHLPDLYPQPERYLPERWSGISPSPYAYLPFGAGPRMCLGAPLAMAILKTVIPTILQRFQLSVVPGTDVTAKVISTMLSPVGPLWMDIRAPGSIAASQPVTGNIATLVDLPGQARPLRRAA